MFFLVSVLLMFPVFSTLFPSTAQAQTTSPKTLTIGMITSVTGGMAPGFKPMVDSAKPTEDLLNQRGGVTIKGQKYNIKIEVVDDQSSPTGAVIGAKKVIQDGIKFVVAPLFMPSNMAILPVFEQAKVFSVSPLCNDPTVFSGKFHYTFNAWSAAYSIPLMDKYFVGKYPNAKKIAILYPDDPGAKALHAIALQSAQKFGLQVVFDEAYALGTMDFSPIVTKALATKPDAINALFGIAPWAGGLINGARQLGFTGPIYAPSNFGDVNTINGMIKQREYANDIINGGPDVLSPTMPDMVKKLGAAMKSRTGAFFESNVFALNALVAMIQVIEKAQSLDTDKVVAAMESMTSYDLVYGKAVPGGPETGGNQNILAPIPVSIITNNGSKVVSDMIRR
jgi:branched-chain amino acid transport system substrate-binding protein